MTFAVNAKPETSPLSPEGAQKLAEQQKNAQQNFQKKFVNPKIKQEENYQGTRIQVTRLPSPAPLCPPSPVVRLL